MSATSFIEFAGASYFISEPDSPTPNQIAITLLRSGNLEQVAAAELSITGSMAQEDVDYQLPFFLPQDVVFESGEAQKTIVVEIQNDMDWEGLETVDFALSKPSLDTEIGSQSTTTLHILDYQTATVEFAREQYTIYESESGETQIALTLTRSGDLHQPAKVRIETVDSQAQEGIDFTIDDPDLSNEVLFEQGEATKTVILTLDKGFYPDPGETIQLGLVDDGDPAVSIGPRGTTTVEIRPANDAPGAIVEFAQARYVTMERETPDAIALTLNRTGDVNAPAEVQIQAAGGTAMEGEDYGLWQDHWQSLNLPESIRFEAGETSKTIFLDTWSDWILEGTEQVTFEIVSQNGQTTIGSNSSAVVDIQDAQLTYVAFAQDSYTVYEGNDSDDRNFLALTLVRTGDLSRFVEVDLLAMGGTATWGIDFYGPNFPETVTFASGETRKTIILDIPSNNWEQEGIEFFKFGLAKSDTSGDPNGADTTPLVIGEQSTTTIRIVEPNPMDQSVVAFKQASYSKGEGTTTAITLTRTGNVNQHAEVMLLLNGGTASYGQDYQIMIDGNFDPGSPTSTSITFAPGEVEKTIWVEVSTEPYPDQEGTEFFTLELASQDNNVLIGDTSTTRMNLLDAETAYVEFAQSRYVGYEGNSGFGDGTTQLAITLVRSGRVDEMVEARLVALGGTADWYGDQTVMGGDFDLSVSAGEVIRFEAGETTKTIIAEINADGTMEGLESFRFGLVGVGGAIAGDQSTTTLEIVDHSDTSGYPGNPTNPDDTAIVEFAEARYVDMEGDQARVAITVTRTGNLDTYSTVELLPNGGTATRDVDYRVFKSEYGDVNPVTLPESLSFNYGEQSKTLLVELMPDQMLEGTEFVTFQLAAGHSLDGMTAIGAQSTTTLEIQDSRLSYVEFGKSHYRVNEEDDTTQIELTLTRSGNLNQDAFAELVFKGGTADWSDFTVDLPGPIEFLTGQTTQTVQVTINPDAMPEGLETVEFGVVGVNGAVTGIQDSATLEILDTTGYNSIVEFAQSRYVTFEHHSLAGPTDGAVTITLTRTGDLSSYTEVELLLNGGTASYQQDYEVVEYIEGLAQPSDFPKLVRFEAGESQKTFTVNVYHYPDNRHDEFVSFEIANLGGYGNGTVIGANSKTTLEILGDESMYQVTSAADSGAGSLREAIHWINTNGGGIIEFALPDGSTIIKLDSALPEITAPVVIDGYTQPGAMENMMAVGFDGILPVQIDGANTQSASGLVLGEGAEGSTIQGLQIYNFDQEGLKVLSSGNTIRGNIIVNNSGDGIQVGDGASIGSSNNVIGGANAGDRNIISGNGDDGIDIKKDSNNNVVKGNYVGLTADGMGAQGNSDMGIQVDGSSNNVIGGAMPGEGNVVSANGANGVFIAVDLENNLRGIATNNQVIGNYIGTDAAGNLNNLGNGEAGVAIAAASDNTVGGTMPGEGNLIMDNGTGIMVLEVDAGLFGTFSANNNSLLGNAINDSMGIGIDLGTLQLNGDIDGLGVSPNDPGDGDTGANGLQNFPVLTSATVENGMLVVEGTLEGMADQEYYLEFFANDMPDGSGYGEGQRFLGSQFIPAGMGGSMPFFFDVPLSPDFVAPGQTITATATAVNMMGNQEFDYLGTSEFSAGIVLQGSSLPNLVISEIMYNPDSSEPGWEWLEVYNAGDTPLDLTGFVLDDDDGTALSQANIAGGLLDVGKTAVLYNADVLTEADFAAAWGDGINLIGVTNWSGLNNSGGDRLALWRSYEDYGARNFEMAIDEVDYADKAINGQSIFLTDLAASNDDSLNWAASDIGAMTPTFEVYQSTAASGNSGNDIASPGTQPPVETASSAQKDFDGDGDSDILTRNIGTDGLRVIQMQGGTFVSHDWIGTLPSSDWQVVATDDFDADADADLLLQNATTGSLRMWGMQAGTRVSNDWISQLPSGWEFATTGDLDGDGDSDILIQDSATGFIRMWQMQDGVRVSNDSVTGLPSGWDIAAVGNFDGDADDDILIQSASGNLRLLRMQSGALVSNDWVGSPTSGWAYAASGDFDGDADADLLIQNTTTGALQMWRMQNGSRASIKGVGTPGTGWQIAATGNFDGDADDDILMRNSSTGSVRVWQLEDGALVSNDFVTTLAAGWDLSAS